MPQILVFAAVWLLLYFACGFFIDLTDDEVRENIERSYYEAHMELDGVPPMDDPPLPSLGFCKTVSMVLLMLVYVLPFLFIFLSLR